MAELLPTRESILDLLPKESVGIEIGVFKGEFSDQILKVVNPSKLYLLDLWSGVVGSGDKDGNNKEYVDLGKFYSEAIIPKYDWDKRVVLLRMKSEYVVTIQEEFDWCYIDGDHSYQGVLNDLNNIYDKIKTGGYICGHDYCERTKGVISAVDEFCKSKGLKINYLTKDLCSSYVIRK
jgi:hypothetical protein